MLQIHVFGEKYKFLGFTHDVFQGLMLSLLYRVDRSKYSPLCKNLAPIQLQVQVMVSRQEACPVARMNPLYIC